MKRLLTPLMLTLLAALAACQSVPPHDQTPAVKAVPKVDLQRYVGTWYEIASYPMVFQRQCVGDTTANYTLRDDGDVAVTNRCRTESSFTEVTGKAWSVEGGGSPPPPVPFSWPSRAD